MNIIQRQADDFILYKMRGHDNYKEFIDNVRSELFEYKKDIYKVEFVERIMQKAKIEFDEHMTSCPNPNDCTTSKFFENTLFFLQEELEELEECLEPKYFAKKERNEINESLNIILADLNELKHGQEITYDDLSNEFEDLKDFYFLNKKNWLQLFHGKLLEMVAGGIIGETLSKEIVKMLENNYEKLIG